MAEEQRHFVGQRDDFEEGTCTIVDVAGESIGIYLVSGTFYGVRNLCPHQLVPICRGTRGGTMLPSAPGQFVYGLDGWVLRCPRHGWEFDLRTGDALFEIDRRRLKTFPVEVDGENVVVIARRPERSRG